MSVTHVDDPFGSDQVRSGQDRAGQDRTGQSKSICQWSTLTTHSGKATPGQVKSIWLGQVRSGQSHLPVIHVGDPFRSGQDRSGKGRAGSGRAWLYNCYTQHHTPPSGPPASILSYQSGGPPLAHVILARAHLSVIHVDDPIGTCQDQFVIHSR